MERGEVMTDVRGRASTEAPFNASAANLACAASGSSRGSFQPGRPARPLRLQPILLHCIASGSDPSGWNSYRTRRVLNLSRRLQPWAFRPSASLIAAAGSSNLAGSPPPPERHVRTRDDAAKLRVGACRIRGPGGEDGTGRSQPRGLGGRLRAWGCPAPILREGAVRGGAEDPVPDRGNRRRRGGESTCSRSQPNRRARPSRPRESPPLPPRASSREEDADDPPFLRLPAATGRHPRCRARNAATGVLRRRSGRRNPGTIGTAGGHASRPKRVSFPRVPRSRGTNNLKTLERTEPAGPEYGTEHDPDVVSIVDVQGSPRHPPDRHRQGRHQGDPPSRARSRPFHRAAGNGRDVQHVRGSPAGLQGHPHVPLRAGPREPRVRDHGHHVSAHAARDGGAARGALRATSR